MSASETRQQIVDGADRLFYEHGYEATSFADIARRAMLDSGEQDARSPADRIRSFVRILIVNRAKIMAHGCPAGTLCNELAKLDHVAENDAASPFTLFRDWLGRQFAALGREADAEALALHVLMRSQGVATLATAFRDEDFIRREVADMEAWLQARCPVASPPQSREPA